MDRRRSVVCLLFFFGRKSGNVLSHSIRRPTGLSDLAAVIIGIDSGGGCRRDDVVGLATRFFQSNKFFATVIVQLLGFCTNICFILYTLNANIHKTGFALWKTLALTLLLSTEKHRILKNLYESFCSELNKEYFDLYASRSSDFAFVRYTPKNNDGHFTHVVSNQISRKRCQLS